MLIVLIVVLSAALLALGVLAAREHGRLRTYAVQAESARKDVAALEKRISGLSDQTRRSEQSLARYREEIRHLNGGRLPRLISGLMQGIAEDPAVWAPLHPEHASDPFEIALREVLGQVRSALAQSRHEVAAADARAEGAARSAVQAATGSVQALGYEMATTMSKLMRDAQLDGHFAEMMELDHKQSQVHRRLQGLRILTGRWPGSQRDSSSLLDVTRGAVSRVRDFTRVRVPDAPAYLVKDRLVEPLALMLAELMDNAARHSAPTTQVEVSYTQTHDGVTIEIHDAGMGMTPEVLEEATSRVSGARPAKFTDMTTPAQFGLYVVGALATKYGFRVFLDTGHSRFGGTRALVRVPLTMLEEQPPDQGHTVASPRTEPQRDKPRLPAPGFTAVPGVQPVPSYQIREDGLPQRRRTPRVASPDSLPASTPPPQGSGRKLGAFLTRHQTAQPHTENEEN